MHDIRKLSKQMLEQKLQETMHVSDIDAKRDIMSILVRARKAEQEGNSQHYAMNDQAMMDQVVCVFTVPTCFPAHDTDRHS
jgi:hypothetical protein